MPKSDTTVVKLNLGIIQALLEHDTLLLFYNLGEFMRLEGMEAATTDLSEIPIKTPNTKRMRI